MAKRTGDIDKRLGERIKAARKGAGFSQEMLGKAIGLSFQQIQKYERGVNRVSVAAVIKISKALSVPVATFFEAIDTSA